ncbi:type II toxin-antitoxin system Phd/YefM family antitoxin [uncultured Sphingomonas sp.]|uniref:type II toxin-antitoxin system Phd/YefM family antitoxin n=1 Tax=uncultured Sphingomonas sp. TaxID=158754 RepID=UPI0035CAC4D6
MKYVGAAEFKANCLRLMAEMQADGEPITVTKRGKPVAVVNPAMVEVGKPLPSAFGLLENDAYRFDIEPGEMVDPDWEAKFDAKWDARLSGDGLTTSAAER